MSDDAVKFPELDEIRLGLATHFMKLVPKHAALAVKILGRRRIPADAHSFESDLCVHLWRVAKRWRPSETAATAAYFDKCLKLQAKKLAVRYAKRWQRSEGRVVNLSSLPAATVAEMEAPERPSDLETEDFLGSIPPFPWRQTVIDVAFGGSESPAAAGNRSNWRQIRRKAAAWWRSNRWEAVGHFKERV